MKFDMTMEEMVAKAKGYTAEQLLGTYEWMSNHFNPIDYTFCDFFGVVKQEILRRLDRGKD